MEFPDIPFTKWQLENGLTLIVHEDHKAPVVAVSIWYRVGSADEPPGKTGFAHLFEHLMFSGTEHHKGSYFEPFEAAGATDQNGTTAFDRTNYFETVPTTALDMALWMESDRMGHLLGAIGQLELDTQRGVVKNEKRQTEGQPYGRIWESLLLEAFPANHPYHHTTLGSMEDLDAASLEDAKQWFRTYYGAANTTLVLAGDITPVVAREKAKTYFGDIPAGPAVTHAAPWCVPRASSTRGLQIDQVPRTRVVREWNIPGMRHADSPLLSVAASILGGDKTSRLAQRLVYRDRLAYSASVVDQVFAVAGMLILSVDIRDDVSLAAVEAAIAEEWEKFLREPPALDEVVRAKASIHASFLRNLEKVGGFTGKAVILAEGQLYRGDPAAYKVDLAAIDAATAASVWNVARRWLAKGDFTLVIRPPESDAEAAAPREPATRGMPPSEGRPDSIAAPIGTYRTAESVIDRKDGVPRVAEFPDLRFPAIHRGRLKNGIEVVLAERDAIPVTHVRIQFNAGFAADHGRKLGTAAVTTAMLQEGTDTLDALEIALRQQRLGAELHGSSNLDVTSLGIVTLNSGLSGALELLSDVARNPGFRDVDLERIRAQTLARIDQEHSNPGLLGERLLPPLLYGKDHVYGAPFSGVGTRQSIEALTVAELQSFHRDFIRADNATIFVVGNTRLTTILPPLEGAFGDWVATSSPLARMLPRRVESGNRGRIYLVNRPGASQAQILGGSLASPTSSPEYLATYLANAVFGGTFTSRLNMNLREDKRWTYGARSVLPDALGQRPLFISTAVQADKTAGAIHEIFKELQAVAGDRPPTQTEIDKVRSQRIRTMPGSYETSSAVLGTLSSNYLYGRPDDFAVTLKAALEGVACAEVTRAARACFVPNGFAWVIAGDLSKIEEPVRALNLGEVLVQDPAALVDA